MSNDTYEMNKEECAKISMLILGLGRVDQSIAIDKARKGLVPSGFSYQTGVIRVSWVSNYGLANHLLEVIAKEQVEVRNENFTMEYDTDIAPKETEPDEVPKRKRFFRKD